MGSKKENSTVESQRDGGGFSRSSERGGCGCGPDEEGGGASNQGVRGPDLQMQKHSGGPRIVEMASLGLWGTSTGACSCMRPPGWLAQSKCGDHHETPSRGTGSTDQGRKPAGRPAPKLSVIATQRHHCPPCSKLVPLTVASWENFKAPQDAYRA